MDFDRLIDLASRRVGGRAVACSDDFFAPKENLLELGRGEFIVGKYTERGKWMDGWESRRRRDGGHDWCIVKLGLAGVVRGVDVDCNHFLGNAPKSCRIEGAYVDGYRPVATLGQPEVSWIEILPDSPTTPGAQNLFRVDDPGVYTHLRLHIYPDGGVARFRAYGEVRPDWPRLLEEHKVLDLAAVEHGGVSLACSDEFFSNKQNLIMPGPSTHMGDGWESKRRRGPGHDWVIVQLGRVGRLRRALLDTAHFKGNFPDSAELEATAAPADTPAEQLSGWRTLVPRTKLEADTAHVFSIIDTAPVTHVRLSIFPDGGVARMRLYGEPILETLEHGRA
jgi:allantoicase